VALLQSTRYSAEVAYRRSAHLLATAAVHDLDSALLPRWVEEGAIWGYGVFAVAEGDAVVRLEEVGGRVDASFGEGARLGDVQAQHVRIREGRRLLVSYRELLGDEGAAQRRVLVLALDLSEIDDAVAAAQRSVLLHLLWVAALLMVVGYVLLTRAVVKPVQRLVDASQRVAEGDFRTRLVVGGMGEILVLAQHFNQMVAALQRSEAAHQKSLAALAEGNAALAAAQESLIRSERLAVVGRLAAGVAHEIGNPLASVLAYLEILDEPGLEAGEAKTVVANAREATRRISQIIRELLDYSRGESPQLSLCSPLDAIAQARRLIEPQPRCRGISFTGPQLTAPLLRIDESRWLQVLVNLFLNACDALQGQGVIRLYTAQDEKSWTLYVADNGPGIAPEIRPHIFAPFFTTKAPGQGTGLGLAICEKVMVEMGGELSLVQADAGTTFALRFSLGSGDEPRPALP